MAGDRIRIDALPTTLYPSLEHFVAAMKDGDTVRLSVEQLLSLYAPPTSPTLDAPTIQNILTLADAAKLHRWGVGDAAIDALIPGVAQGTLLEGAPGRHLTLGVQSGAADTGLYVIDKGNAATPASAAYANLLLALSRNQFKYQTNDIWHAGNFARGEELISSGVVSSSTANVEITLPAAYKTFRLRGQHIKPNVATSGYLAAQAKAGGLWYTGVSAYVWVNHYVTLAGNHSFWGSGTFSNAFALNNGAMGVSGSPSPSSNFEMAIFPGSPTGNFPPLFQHQNCIIDGGGFAIGQGGAELGVNNRIEAIRLLFTSQNIGNMEWFLWGQR